MPVSAQQSTSKHFFLLCGSCIINVVKAVNFRDSYSLTEPTFLKSWCHILPTGVWVVGEVTQVHWSPWLEKHICNT